MAEEQEFQEQEEQIGNEEQVPAGEEAESLGESTDTHQEESDTAQDEETEEQKQQRINQEAVNARINEKHKEAQLAKQEAAEARKRAEEAEKKLAEVTAQKPPEIPPMPDYHDDNFEEKMKERDNAIRARAKYDKDQEDAKQFQLKAEQEQLNRQREALNKSTEIFYQRSDELGLNQAELDANIQTVVSYGFKGEIGLHVLNDPAGPLIVNYLAANPLALDEISKMGTVQAAIYLETEVKPEAAKLKPRTTSAPPPPKTAGGGGAPPKERGPKGATFE